jgi:hypothetical protein
LTGQAVGRAPSRFCSLLAVALGVACVLALSVAPSQATRLRFGTEDHLVKLQDVEIKGPQGELLYLGYKYSFHNFLLPYTVTDDGYVLGVRGQKAFFKLDEARIKSLQASGLLPSPLPRYKLSLFDLAIGHALWAVVFVILAPLIILRSIFLTLRVNRRRKRAIPHFEGAVADHRAGNLDAAIDGYTRAIEADGKLALAFHSRGKAFEAKATAARRFRTTPRPSASSPSRRKRFGIAVRSCATWSSSKPRFRTSLAS